MNKEIWIPIVGFESRFEVSNTQKVRSIYRVIMRRDSTIQTFKQKELRIFIGSRGYKLVGLCCDGVQTTRTLHSLVAEAHILKSKIPKGMCVNHIDGIKVNCVPENLEIVTYSQNMIHAHKNGLNTNIGATHTNSKTTTSEVSDIRRLHKEGVSQNELAKMYNISRSSVQKIVQFKTRKTG